MRKSERERERERNEERGFEPCIELLYHHHVPFLASNKRSKTVDMWSFQVNLIIIRPGLTRE